MLIRRASELLSESMKEVKQVNNFDELFNYFDEDCGCFEHNTDHFKIEYYCYDDRIDWNTYLITYKGQVIGYANSNDYL